MTISYLDAIRVPLAYAAGRARSLRNRFTLLKLKVKGCVVDPSANVHPSVVAERSNGVIRVGANTSLDMGVVIRALGGGVQIGRNCNVNAYTLISGAGGVVIGDEVMIASHVSIYASNHIFSGLNLPMQQQGLSLKGVVIENDVWVGTGVRILDGVRIGTGSVLAAGAVITKSTNPYSINAGVPSRQIGSRKSGFPAAS